MFKYYSQSFPTTEDRQKWHVTARLVLKTGAFHKCSAQLTNLYQVVCYASATYHAYENAQECRRVLKEGPISKLQQNKHFCINFPLNSCEAQVIACLCNLLVNSYLILSSNMVFCELSINIVMSYACGVVLRCSYFTRKVRYGNKSM